MCGLIELGTYWTILGAWTLTLVAPQRISTGVCPNPLPMPEFNVTKYAGRWYEMEKYWFSVEATMSCGTVDYFPNFDVDIKQIEGLTQLVMRNTGHTRFLSFDGSADVSLELLISQSPIPFSVHFPYRILATDYFTYTIKYSCTQVGPLKIEGLWILSKTKKGYNAQTRAKVRRILAYYGLDTMSLIPSANMIGAKCPW